MSIRIGTAPDSWGVWFPNNDKQISWNRCMDEMREAGYDGVELGPWGYFPNTYETLAPELQKRSLELVATTVGGNFIDATSVKNMLSTIDEMASLQKDFPSARFVVLLPEMFTDLMTGKQTLPTSLTSEEWKTMYENIGLIDRHVRQEHGLVATLHPHVECHVQSEEEIERVLENTDIALCLDTGHHIYGGGEPTSFFSKHHARIPYLHIKDCDLGIKREMDEHHWPFAEAVTKGIMCEPGKGGIDFGKFFSAARAAQYDGWAVVEQDMYPVQSFDAPLNIAKNTRKYLRNFDV